MPQLDSDSARLSLRLTSSEAVHRAAHLILQRMLYWKLPLLVAQWQLSVGNRPRMAEAFSSAGAKPLVHLPIQEARYGQVCCDCQHEPECRPAALAPRAGQ